MINKEKSRNMLWRDTIMFFLFIFAVMQMAPAVEAAGTFDRTPPNTINDLRVVLWSRTGEAVLTWTAPGDDGTTGKASSYLIKYATFVVASLDDDDATWWNVAKTIDIRLLSLGVTAIPTPSEQGTMEVLQVKGLPIGQGVIFNVRAKDEAGNLSPFNFENLIAQEYMLKVGTRHGVSSEKEQAESRKSGKITDEFFIKEEKKLFITFVTPDEVLVKYVRFVSGGRILGVGEIISCISEPGLKFSCDAVLATGQEIHVGDNVIWEEIKREELNLLPGRSYFQEDNVADVVQIYDSAIKKYPSGVIFYRHLANLFIKQGMTGYALDIYYACLEKNPDAADARRGLALLCEKLEREVPFSFGKYKRQAIEQWMKLLMADYDEEARAHIEKLR